MAWLYIIPVFTIESLALLVGLLVLLRYYLHRKWQFFAERNIPHEPPKILKLGNVGTVGFGKRVFTIDNERKQKLGMIYGLYLGWNPVLVIHDLDILRQIYIGHFKEFPDRQAILTRMNGKKMNHGLTIVQGNKWKRIRSTLSPTFSVSKLKLMFSIAEQCANQTLAVLQRKCEVENGKFVPRTVFSNLSLDMIVSTALGTKGNTQMLDGEETRMESEVRKAFKIGLSGVLVFSVMFFPSLETLYEKLGLSIFPKQSLDYVAKFVNAVIDKRLESCTEQEKPKDLLQLMLDAEVPDESLNEGSVKGLTRDELVGNAMLMVGAGFENTANSMVFLAYNLAFHPDVQSRLQREVDDVFTEKGSFDYETIHKMKYLDMCLNETLRLYSPVLANARICRKETTVNGLTIPKDMAVNIPVFGLCHEPEYWDEPWKFNPERMEDMSKIDPMVFQPFGAGPRNCIGMRFALMEIKLTFCKIMRNFTFEPCEETPKPPLELSFGIGVRPAKEFPLPSIRRK